MPFREKIKKAFGRSPSTSTNSSSPTTITPVDSLSQFSSVQKTKSKDKKKKKKEDEEAMPKPKYRAPVDPNHKATLEAFSFSGAFEAIRRKSAQSAYSPMGSRMPSRMGSRASERIGGASRQQSFAVPSGVDEAEDRDDDVGNVGLSKHHTKEDTEKNTENGEELDKSRTVTLGEELDASRTITNGQDLQASKTITNGQLNGIRDER